MKKSKIIIPALAMIAFSVAASITGTVAWFTATRTATINAGTYAVVKTTSDLSVTLSNGIGTTASSNTVTVAGELTDGSFDHTAGNIYTPNEEGKAIKSEIALASANATNMKRGTDPSNSKTIYTVCTFGIAFKMTWSGSSNDVGLYLDATKSVFATEGTSTAKGFRMAFYPASGQTTTAAKVFADLQTSANCKYINDDEADIATGPSYGGVAYASADLIHSGYSDALPASPATTDKNSRPDCLGYFAYSSATIPQGQSAKELTLNFTAVCWYEGTDPNITSNATNFESVVATLYFEAKDIIA